MKHRQCKSSWGRFILKFLSKEKKIKSIIILLIFLIISAKSLFSGIHVVVNHRRRKYSIGEALRNHPINY